MSDYTSQSIKEILKRIESSDHPLYLPSIQRHFVWKPERICKLFDSIMSGYPIGTFLFWDVPDIRRDEYAFYKFIQNFSEFDKMENDPTSRSLPLNVTGVLDGQQRLNSMFVALTGTYEQFKGGRGRSRNSRNSFLTRRLYINVLAEPEEEGHWTYDFDFLSDCELAWRMKHKDEAWFLAGDALHWNDVSVSQEVWQALTSTLKDEFELTAGQHDRAISTLSRLYDILHKDDLITYYSVRDRELTEALEIFVRVNSGGITLNQTDLYFSTIAAYWKEGRSEVERFLNELNNTGNCFDFEISALMLACLSLSDAPIKLKVESFGPAHVDRIRDQWESIQSNLTKAAELLDSWGFSGNNKTSVYAIMPVALAVKVDYDMESSAEDLRQLVIRSLISDFYSRGTNRRNRILTLIRGFMQQDASENRTFSLDKLKTSVTLPAGSSLDIGENAINELLEMSIGHPKVYVLLSLLHGQHAYHQKTFDKDHIHPRSGFENLSNLQLSPNQENNWRELRDQLPNLQLLQSGDNNFKRAKPFEEWLSVYRRDDTSRNHYLSENDIPSDVSLDFRDFEEFFAARREILRVRLHTLLGTV